LARFATFAVVIEVAVQKQNHAVHGEDTKSGRFLSLVVFVRFVVIPCPGFRSTI
jgi:hypothetical protein